MTDAHTSPAALFSGEMRAKPEPAVSGIPEYVTVDQIAAKLQVSRAFVYREIEAGNLECDRFGERLKRVTVEQFNRYRNRPKQSPEAA